MSYTDEWTCDRIKYIAETSRCMSDGYIIDDGVTLNIINKSVALIDVHDNVAKLKQLFFEIERLYNTECKVREFMNSSDTTIIVHGGHNVTSMNKSFRLHRIHISNDRVYCPIRFDLRCFDMRNVSHMMSTFENCGDTQEILFGTDKVSKIQDMMDTFRDCYSLQKLDLQCIHTDCIVPELWRVFERCYSIEEINMPNFTNAIINHYGQIFDNCRSLKVLNCPNIRINKIWKKAIEHVKELDAYCEYYDSINRK